MSTTIRDLIRSRGHWDVEIRPGTFVETRVPKKTQLASILTSAAVSMRGWDFPHIDRQDGPRIRNGWIEQETQWNHYLESTRFYQSGLLIDLSAFKGDWRDQSELWPAEEGWKWGTELDVTEVVFRFVEIFEFVSRLANSPAGDEVMHVEVKCLKLSGRKLIAGPNRIPFFPSMTTTEDKFSYAADVTRPQLIAPRDLAIRPAAQIFELFAWDAPDDLLRDIQRELGALRRR